MLSENSNIDLLKKRILELEISGNKIFCLDFDELVIENHLTRDVTTKISKEVNKEKLKELGSCSFEGIKYLNSLFYGKSLIEYEKIRNKLAKESKWRDGFLEFFKKLSSKYSVVFISSGLKDICEAKLQEINFNPKNIIGGEVKIEDDKIIGSNLVISDKLKGYVIKELREEYEVISIGHSLGDKEMLNNANLSISINSNIEGLAQHNFKSFEEVWSVI